MENCICPHFEIFDEVDQCGYHGRPLSEIEQCHLSEQDWGIPKTVKEIEE